MEHPITDVNQKLKEDDGTEIEFAENTRRKVEFTFDSDVDSGSVEAKFIDLNDESVAHTESLDVTHGNADQALLDVAASDMPSEGTYILQIKIDTDADAEDDDFAFYLVTVNEVIS